MIGQAVEREVWPLIEQGRIKPIVDSVFPFAKVARGAGENGREQPYRENPADPLAPVNSPLSSAPPNDYIAARTPSLR